MNRNVEHRLGAGKAALTRIIHKFPRETGCGHF